LPIFVRDELANVLDGVINTLFEYYFVGVCGLNFAIGGLGFG